MCVVDKGTNKHAIFFLNAGQSQKSVEETPHMKYCIFLKFKYLKMP
jgi:hypothetical protein